MIKWLRTAALWLLMASLPLQGMAGAAMAACPPDHHSATAEAMVHVVGVEGASHCEHDEGAASSPSGHNSANCCSAMCSVAGLSPSTLFARLPGPGSVAPAAAVAQIYLGITPDGLERPPRNILA